MKLNLSFYVPFGPIGHPKAAPIAWLVSQDKNELEGQAHAYLSKRSSQNTIPTVFFDEDKSLSENGYYILKVNGDEISDEEIAALPILPIFTPAKQGMPGRKLQQFKQHIPYFFHHFNFEVWEEGKSDCDHDFGLESYKTMFKEHWTDKIMEDSDTDIFEKDGSFYVAVTCSRCGAVHALKEEV